MSICTCPCLFTLTCPSQAISHSRLTSCVCVCPYTSCFPCTLTLIASYVCEPDPVVSLRLTYLRTRPCYFPLADLLHVYACAPVFVGSPCSLPYHLCVCSCPPAISLAGLAAYISLCILSLTFPLDVFPCDLASSSGSLFDSGRFPL